VPSGIVDSIEYWITFDVGVGNDSVRTYIQIGRFQNTNGSILTEDALVSYTYSGLGQGDFFVKVRGVNNITTGPYSDPSGLVSYKPVVVADTLSDEPVSIGGQLMGLGLLTLLNNLDKLFGGSTTAGGLFDKVFDLFKDVTGVDLVGQASGGDLVVASDLEISADGDTLGTTTASIDFIGPIEASGSSAIEVKLKDGTKNKDILAWNAATGKWETISDCITCNFPVVPPVIPPVPCSLKVTSTLPANNFQGANSLCPTTTTVPFTGSYFIKFYIYAGTALGGGANPSKSIVAPLVKGTGSFKLYGTDGTLEQTLPIASAIVHNDTLELPFSNRTPGKDYYIIWDEGVVTNCDCENALVDNATTWTFTTSPNPQPAYTLGQIGPLYLGDDALNSDASVRTRISFSYSPTSSVCSTSQKMVLTFSQKIKKGSGSITIKDRASGSTVATMPVSSATITQVGTSSSWKADFGTIPSLDVGKYYDVNAPVGLLLTDPAATSVTVCDKTTNTPADPVRQSRNRTWGFKTGEPLKITSFEVCKEASGNARQRTNIIVYFNKSIKTKTGVAEVSINGSGLFGGLFQKIDLNGTYANKKYGDISDTGPTNQLIINPTQQMKGDSEYYLNIPAGVIFDAECDVAWDGDSTTVKWKTDGAAASPPEKLTLGSIFFDFNFERPVVPGQGKLNIIAVSDGRLLAQVGANDVAMKIKNNVKF
jgi:hypothetical protein